MCLSVSLLHGITECVITVVPQSLSQWYTHIQTQTRSLWTHTEGAETDLTDAFMQEVPGVYKGGMCECVLSCGGS